LFLTYLANLDLKTAVLNSNFVDIVEHSTSKVQV